jgi:hypothetical protein
MRSVAMAIALLYAVACGGPTKKPVDLENDQVDGETCCCRWTPIGAENGRPTYEEINRMECSQKQGECMAASNCTGGSEPAQ